MQQDHPIIERRIAARVAVERPVTIVTEGGERAATTVNVSASGVLVALAGELTIWADVRLALPGTMPRDARVARRDGDRYGLVFREPLSAAELTAFTGIEQPMDTPVETAPPPRPAGRTAPWAFGRDRLKTLRREHAERQPPRQR